MNNEEFIIIYLNKEKYKNLKNFMRTTLNKYFRLEELKNLYSFKI